MLNETIIEDVKIGTGRVVESGDNILIHYTGMLMNGTIFDSSVERNEPLECQIGVGQLIQGWDKGIVGLAEGGSRKLTIPYSQAYGDRGFPPIIPPKSDLVFEVELIKVL
jgi:FKBP-type peptidyl-prolyl cis-trans isomerase